MGFLQVHLFRPFSRKHLMAAMPKTVKKIAVLDRVKEIGSIGEPLYEDICAAYINESDRPAIYAGRYGLSSKDTTPPRSRPCSTICCWTSRRTTSPSASWMT